MRHGRAHASVEIARAYAAARAGAVVLILVPAGDPRAGTNEFFPNGARIRYRTGDHGPPIETVLAEEV